MATGSEDEEDVLLRDRKSLSLAGWGAAFPFLLAVCLLLLLPPPPPSSGPSVSLCYVWLTDGRTLSYAASRRRSPLAVPPPTCDPALAPCLHPL
jgi:hypothetical protein